MSFEKYSYYYDLLYEDKNYESEVEYVKTKLLKQKQNVKTILEFGSGTGRHARLLAQKGFEVYCIEKSQTMIDKAHSEINRLNHQSVHLEQGDLRKVRIGKTFDAVIALFHVLSYQTSNLDAQAMFETAAIHLDTGGLFLFDCWYGPAVLTDRPETRVKTAEDNTVEVIRIAKPVMFPNKNIVEVHYKLLAIEKSSANFQQINEVHPMRYFFLPEIELMLESSKFKLISTENWLDSEKLGFSTWNATFIAEKQ